MSTARGGEALDRWLARAVLAAAGVVAATAVAVAGLWLWRPATAAGGAASPASGYTLAYIGNAAGEGVDLYLADAAGENATRLTETVADESWPAWSPDGRWLAYVRAATTAESAVLDAIDGLYLLSWEGNTPRETLLVPATEAGLGAPFWSPDGRHVGMIGRPPAGEERLQPAVVLTLCEAATGACEAQEVGVEEAPTGLEGAPAWTTDGRAVIFSGPSLAESRGGVLTPLRLELATGALTQLTYGGQYAAVSARGMVAYLGVPPGEPQVWMVSAAGGVRQRIGGPLASEMWCWGLAWSPDGRRLASVEGSGDTSLLVIRTAEGGEVAEYPTPLGGRHAALRPAWSADGRYVAYTVLTDLDGPVPAGTLVVADTETDAVAAWPAEPGVLQAFAAWRP